MGQDQNASDRALAASRAAGGSRLRSLELIHRRSIDNLQSTIVVMATVAVVILLFLWHIPSAVVPLITIPLAVLIAFIPFRMLGINSNIMSLGESPSPSAPWWMPPSWWSSRPQAIGGVATHRPPGAIAG